MQKLNLKEQQHLDWSRQIVRSYKRSEMRLIDVFTEAEDLKIYKKLGIASLFKFGVEHHGLSPAVTYSAIAIARKSREVPQLKTCGLTLPVMTRFVSLVTPENADSWIAFAKNHTVEEINFEVARQDPKAASRDRVKPLSSEYVEVKVCLPIDVYESLRRVETLEANKGLNGLANAIAVSTESYLYHSDPVRKAGRAAKRAEKSMEDTAPSDDLRRESKPVANEGSRHEELCTYRVRKTMKAAPKHTVNSRDGGRCMHIDESGRRCNEQRWIQIHHINKVSLGGSDEPENLLSLCAFHHNLVHRLELPVEVQKTWKINSR